MLRYWRHLFSLAVESQYVVALRLTRLIEGGPSAIDEARRILLEKSAASAELPLHLIQGRSALWLTVSYRKTVRTNLRRLRQR